MRLARIRHLGFQGRLQQERDERLAGRPPGDHCLLCARLPAKRSRWQLCGVPVGDQVVGIMAGSLASHATGPATFVVRLPESLTPEQAVTVPIAYTTAEFALRHCAGIRTDDRVLVHAAAGGVGSK